ncbi:MAG: PhoH family protein, partial [Lachnospiraceae bacterium]|nr:PhoH family protein [Lachnospiraceae bacterium]
MIKNYVLDTNILLQDPTSIYGFDDNNVYITGTTLQELDSKKNVLGEVGYNARECIRILDTLREEGDLTLGIELPNKGHLFVEPDGVSQENLPNGFDISKPDNRILSTGVYLQKKHSVPTILVSSDLAMRISASVILGAGHVQNYKNTFVEKSDYTGHVTIETEKENIDDLYKVHALPDEAVRYDKELYENEFVTLKCGQASALTVHRGHSFEQITGQTIFGGTKAMNQMQNYIIWALMQPAESIPLVILQGPAGTAKTYLSLAAGLSQTYVSQRRDEGRYYKMLISRPNAEAGDPGFGYLPGDLEEKMAPLLAPYYDNLETLFSGQNKEDRSQVQMQINDLFDQGIIEVCALSFIRGRSLSNSYIICDEAQNASQKL